MTIEIEPLLNRIDTITACLQELGDQSNLSYAVIRERVRLLRQEIERNPEKPEYIKACSTEVSNAESLLGDTIESERVRLKKRSVFYKIGYLLFGLLILGMGILAYIQFSPLVLGAFLMLGVVGVAGLTLDLTRINKHLKKQSKIQDLFPFLKS